MRFSLAR